MLVAQAFPKLFSRSIPLLDGQATILEGARMLTSLQVGAVMISSKPVSDGSEKYRALTGCSILSKLLLKEGDLLRFLASRSDEAAQEIRVLKENDTIESIITAIRESGVGIVLVSSQRNHASPLFATIELRDFIRLYRNATNLPETNWKIGDFATSPVVSVKHTSTLKDILKTMLKYKVRKILLSETESLVSDRDILSYITRAGAIESAEMMFKTPASELPSSQPPWVDSKMSIKGALQLMNPDTGDCLICDRGLVTFWDLVIKLGQSATGKELLLKDRVASKNQDILSLLGNPEKENPQNTKKTENTGMSKSQVKRFEEIGKRLHSQGFITIDDVPRFARSKVVDPFYLENPARPFRLNGVCSGRKGGTRFSAVDLFGLRMLDESYYVSNWEKFSKFIGQRLELMFRAANPDPSRGTKTAFTRFVHNFGLHWTDCEHVVQMKKHDGNII